VLLQVFRRLKMYQHLSSKSHAIHKKFLCYQTYLPENKR
jgi:hypothetical protein